MVEDRTVELSAETGLGLRHVDGRARLHLGHGMMGYRLQKSFGVDLEFGHIIFPSWRELKI